MPKWLKPYIQFIAGGDDQAWVEEIMNDHKTTVFENAPRALICVSMKAQVGLLARLAKDGRLSDVAPETYEYESGA